jgi:photosystem II stability/assembly factor-like uncharacterized protein
LPDNWDVIFYGDGFYCNVDFLNSDIIYVEAQYGYLGKSTDGGYYWDIIRDGIDQSERTNWNTPVVMSMLDNNILFYGAEKLYKTINGGNYWNAISPNLTGGNQPGSLVYGTITTIGQSNVNGNVIWAGTDDSRVWVTTDGGANWNLVSQTLPDRWCTRVSPDPHDEYTAYVTFSGYKADDQLSHIFKTTDYGNNWTDISGNLVDIPVNDIIPDLSRPGYLYVGTDFGVFYSTNDGTSWEALGDNHPISPVFDIDIHVGEQKLVSGTHGRSMYSYDLMQLEQTGCDYFPGDANNSTIVNGLDLVYLVAYFKGGPSPPYFCECANHGNLYVAADANGSCEINGLDVTYMLNYFKGGPEILFCSDCPPIG